MPWNWQLPDWPKFHFHSDRLQKMEKQFLLTAGSAFAFLKKIDQDNRRHFAIEILCTEGEESSRIEGEILDRESLQSSIQGQFGLAGISRLKPKEAAMAALLFDVYDSYMEPLTHEKLCSWHAKLFPKLLGSGKYREHEEPMQIVRHRLDHPKVFFEAPPSKRVYSEMQLFIEWYNSLDSSSILAKTAIAHLYFENIHPFEDGNGRIGRALVEKSLSQALGRPLLIAVSKVLEKRKKEYYQALESCNQTLDASFFVDFFAEAIIQAQQESLLSLNFIIEKSKLMLRLEGRLNSRQEKALLRMFQEGPEGFKGGLSAEKYIAITGATRSSATRDLAELVDLGALRKTGELRHTRYWLHIEA